jgi:hypothetical protein
VLSKKPRRQSPRQRIDWMKLYLGSFNRQLYISDGKHWILFGSVIDECIILSVEI